VILVLLEFSVIQNQEPRPLLAHLIIYHQKSFAVRGTALNLTFGHWAFYFMKWQHYSHLSMLHHFINSHRKLLLESTTLFLERSPMQQPV
jgi:hypothetical protein